MFGSISSTAVPIILQNLGNQEQVQFASVAVGLSEDFVPSGTCHGLIGRTSPEVAPLLRLAQAINSENVGIGSVPTLEPQ